MISFEDFQQFVSYYEVPHYGDETLKLTGTVVWGHSRMLNLITVKEMGEEKKRLYISQEQKEIARHLYDELSKMFSPNESEVPAIDKLESHYGAEFIKNLIQK